MAREELPKLSEVMRMKITFKPKKGKYSTDNEVLPILLEVEIDGLLQMLNEQNMSSITKYIIAQHLVRFCNSLPLIHAELEHSLALLDATTELLFAEDNIPLTDELIRSYANGKVVKSLLRCVAKESHGILTLGKKE